MPKIYYDARRGRPLGARLPPGISRSKYDPELAAAICRRIAGGESVVSICADLAMPCAKTIWWWNRRHEDFALMLRHARETARAAALARSLAAEAAEVAAIQAWWRPGYRGRPCRYSYDWAQAICGRLARGEPLEAICRDPAMPGKTTLYRWLRREPAFRALYREAREIVAKMIVHVAHEDAPWLGTEAASKRNLRRRVRAAERQVARLSLQAYAPATGPKLLNVIVEDPDGARRVIYGDP